MTIEEAKSVQPAEAGTAPRRNRKSRVGVVVSDKMAKTVVIEIVRLVEVPMYRKRVRRHVRIKAHDERQEAKVGDRVEIVETRPISKDKRWRVRRIIEKARLG
jgi:small subunit ribosomal protein S17